jgi:hypothetical protein
MGKGKQTAGPGSAPGFARETGMPKSGQLSQKQAKNTLDQAKGAAPDRGQTRGGSRQGGKSSGD